MKTYKFLLLGLLFLISLSLIFTTPGVRNLENFNNELRKLSDNSKKINTFETAAKHPPGTYAIFKSILNYFPPDSNIPLFYKQTSWFVSKIILFLAYILTWISLLYLTRSIKKIAQISLVDVSIAYFASASILLSTLALSFFEILAAPFLILSLTLLFQNKFSAAGLFYLAGLSFNWTLLVFAPMFFLFFMRTKKQLQSANAIPILAFLVIPSMLVIGYLANYDKDGLAFQRILSQILSFPWLVNHFSFYFLEKTIAVKLVNTLSHVGIFLFVLIYIYLVARLRTLKKISGFSFINCAFCLYLVFILLFPNVSEGNLVWLVLISLFSFILSNTVFSTLQLIFVNLLIFINLFLFFGAAGTPPVRGEYFDFFKLLFLAIISVFAIMYITPSYKSKFFTLISEQRIKNYIVRMMKKFLIVSLVLLNLSLIPAQGSPDTVSWSQYAIASVEYVNPFRAYTEVVLQYPPLSIVVISFFANLWKEILEASKDYAISTKLSIFVFYLLTVLAYLKFNTVFHSQDSLRITDKLLIILTTFSLIIQTQGLADINIYIVPSLITAIIALWKEKFLISGILLGLTISIKWQPTILLPLFLATTFKPGEAMQISLRQTGQFMFGLLIIPAISWYLVLIEPNGPAAIIRAFEFFLQGKGAAMLSGQALNLNWIVTYAIHIFQSELDVSLQHLGGLNRQVPTSVAPSIFQGYLFLIAAAVIIVRYWLLQKKNIVNFLSAAMMIFFSHFMLNRSAYEKHLFYTVILMLFLFLLHPTKGNRLLLILFDIMTVMNLVFFYGFTGPKDVPRLFFGFDITVAFAAYYVVIFAWVFLMYLKGRLLVNKEKI